MALSQKELEDNRKRIDEELKKIYNTTPKTINREYNVITQPVYPKTQVADIAQVANAASQLASQPKPVNWQTRPYWQPWEENEYNGLTDAKSRIGGTEETTYINELEKLRMDNSLSSEEYRKRLAELQANDPLTRNREKLAALEQGKAKAHQRDAVSPYEGVMSLPDFAEHAEAAKGGIKTQQEYLSQYGNVAEAAKNVKIENPVYYQWLNREQTVNGNKERSSSMSVPYMTENEMNVYNYYFSKYGKQKADEYYKKLEPILYDRSFEESARIIREEMPGYAKVVLPILTDMVAPLAFTENAFNVLRGAETDSNRGINSLVRLSGVAQQDVLKDAGPLGQFLGNIGYSLVNMGTKLPFGPAGGLAYMSSSAAGHTTADALERGADSKTALMLGTLSGAIEFATEKLPLDNLFKVAKQGGRQSVTQAVKGVFKQAGIEATEETVSEYANTITDMALMGDQSEYMLYKNSLLEQGMSDAEATKLANLKFFVENPFMSAAGGAVSGGFFGTGASIMNAANNGMALRTYRTVAMPDGTKIAVDPNGRPVSVTGTDGVKTAVTDGMDVGEAVERAMARTVTLPDGRQTQVRVDENGNPVSAPQNAPQTAFSENGITYPANAENAPVNGTEAGRTSWKQRVSNHNGVYTIISSDGQRSYTVPASQEVSYSVTNNGTVKLNKSVAESVNSKDYRDFAKAYADKNLVSKIDSHGNMLEAKPITILSDGNEVIITPKGINDVAKKIRGQGMKSKDNLDSIFLLDKIIENSHKVGESPNTKGRVNPFSYYESNFSVGNRNYKVNLRIKNTPQNNQYYYHSLENIEIAPSNETSYHNNGGPDLIVNDAISTPIIPNSSQNSNTAENIVFPPYSDVLNKAVMPGITRNVKTGLSEESNIPTPPNLELLKELNRKYGTIPKGADPRAREVSVPKQTTDDTKVRRTVRSILESKISDQDAGKIGQEIINHTYDYHPISDKSAQNTASRTIERKGLQGALNQWDTVVNGTHTATKNDIVLAEKLLLEASESGDTKTVLKLTAEIAAEATRAGQTVQAVSDIKKMGPEGQLYYLQKSIDSTQKDLNGRYKDKAPQLKINESYAEELLNAKTQKEIEAASQKIILDIAGQVPATWVDKWNNWRYLAMLANPRTHIRNIIGNAVFLPARQMKNVLKIGMEKAFLMPGERTAAILTPKDSELIRFANSDFKDQQSGMMDGGKYNPSNAIMENRTIYNFKPLENIRKGNSWALNAEDALFKRLTYVDSMAQAIKARKLDVDFLQSGTKEANQQLNSIRAYAKNEALKATYQDASKLASALNRFKQSNAVASVIGEGLLPFTKTPVNILKRGVEYSPAGLIKGLTEAVYGVRRGKATAAQAIDSIASGMTGTGVMALGMWLASMGLIAGGGSDDKKEKGFETLQGEQAYALKIGDTYYTIDWMAPISLPLFVGVEAFNTLQDQDGFSFGKLMDNLSSITEPMFNLSMLDGVNSVINSVSYSEGNKLTNLLTELGTSYLTQSLPTLGGQIARTIDGTRRNAYYVDKNSDVPVAAQNIINTAKSKIPGLSFTLPARVDQWGREDHESNIALRAFENFISPGYISTRNETAVDKEIAKIYKETGESKVLPAYASKSFTSQGETTHFTASEYTDFAKKRGQLSYNTINELLSDPDYQKLSAGDKAEMISDIYGLSNAVAKAETSDKYTVSSQYVKAYEANKQAGILYGDYLMYKMNLGASPNMEETIDALNDSGLSNSQKKYLFAKQFPNTKRKPFG